MNNLHDLPSEFHTVVVGTGIVESLVAAALARCGKSVLHVDKNEFYGGSNASYAANDFLDMFEPEAQATTAGGNNNAENDAAPLPELSVTEHMRPIVQAHKSFANIVVTPFQSQRRLDPALSRKFAIDLCPRLLWCSGTFVDMLLRASVSRYLEFKCLHSCAMHVQEHFEEVPCSKGGVFKNKFISLKEKRQIMKLLESVLQPSADDLAALETATQRETSFLEFLKERGTTENVIAFLLYSIALVENKDAPISTQEGMRLLQRFMKSIGRYGETPFLFPLYGNGEIPQAYCRLSAVYGGTYMLRWPLSHYEIDPQTQRCNAIHSKEGQRITTLHVVSNVDNFTNFATDEVLTSLSRCVLVTKRGITENNELKFLTIPPNSKYGNVNSIYILQLDHTTMVTPNGMCMALNSIMIHFTTRTVPGNTAKGDLKSIVDDYFKKAPEDPTKEYEEKEEEESPVLWEAYFNMLGFGTKPGVPENVHFVDGVVDSVDSISMDAYLEQAKAIFAKICPDEEFMETVPHPEDIIYTVEEEKPAEPVPEATEDQKEETLEGESSQATNANIEKSEASAIEANFENVKEEGKEPALDTTTTTIPDTTEKSNESATENQ